MINQYKLSIFTPIFKSMLDPSDLKSILQADSKNQSYEILYQALSEKISNKKHNDYRILQTLIQRVNSPEHELQFLLDALFQVKNLEEKNPFKKDLTKSICLTLMNYLIAFLETAMVTGALVDATFFNPALSTSVCTRLLFTFGIDRFSHILSDKYLQSIFKGEAAEFNFDATNAQALLFKLYKDITGIRDFATIKQYAGSIFETTCNFAKSNLSFFTTNWSQIIMLNRKQKYWIHLSFMMTMVIYHVRRDKMAMQA